MDRYDPGTHHRRLVHDVPVSDAEQRFLVGVVQRWHRGSNDTMASSAHEAELRVVRANMGLVRSLAAAMAAKSPADREDLESVGYEALVRAIRAVDLTSSGDRPLSYYFGAAVQRAQVLEVRRALAARRGLSVRALSRPGAGETTTPRGLVALDEAGEIADTAVSVEDQVISADTNRRVAEAVSTLAGDERELLALRYGVAASKASQRQVGWTLKWSRRQVQRREAAVLRRLRAVLR